MTPLHHIGNAVRELMLQIPLEAVRAVFVGLPLAVLVWVLMLPKEETQPPESPRWDANLKVWAAVALAFQIAIYSWL